MDVRLGHRRRYLLDAVSNLKVIKRNVILALAGAFAATFTFNLITEFVPWWGLWYNAPSLPYRLQSDALLNGHLWLFDRPILSTLDLVWHDQKIHQVWGLGVPLLRLPFDLLARLSGSSFFPDRLILLTYYFLLAAFALWVHLRSTDGVLPLMGRILLTGQFLFAVPLLIVAQTRFEIYEESVVYGYLWLVFLLHVMWRATRETGPATVIVLGIGAGLAPYFRPTLVFPGLASLALVLLAHRRRLSRSLILTSSGIFVFLVSLLLVSNTIRFGAPLEFGHRLNLSSDPTNAYFLKFGFPYSAEPLVSAARELIMVLFGNPPLNGFQFFSTGLFPGVSATLRFRELYFTFFNLSHAIFFVAGLLVLGVAAYRLKEKKDAPSNNFDLSMIGAWGLFSFLALFAFYLQSPSLTSRYLIDFMAPIIAVQGLVTLVFFEILKPLPTTRARVFGELFSVAIALGMIVTYQGGQISKTHRDRYLWTERAVQVYERRAQKEPVPARNELQIKSGPHRGVTGWNLDTGTLSSSVQLFLANPHRLVLTFGSQSGRPLTEKDFSSARLRIGSKESKRTKTEIDGSTARVTFESERPETGLQAIFMTHFSQTEVGKESDVVLKKVAVVD